MHASFNSPFESFPVRRGFPRLLPNLPERCLPSHSVDPALDERERSKVPGWKGWAGKSIQMRCCSRSVQPMVGTKPRLQPPGTLSRRCARGATWLSQQRLPSEPRADYHPPGLLIAFAAKAQNKRHHLLALLVGKAAHWQQCGRKRVVMPSGCLHGLAQRVCRGVRPVGDLHKAWNSGAKHWRKSLTRRDQMARDAFRHRAIL